MTKPRKQKRPSARGPAVDPWVTLLGASRVLGRHRQTVLQLALEHGLTVEQRAGMRFLLRAELEALRDRLAEDATLAAAS